MASLLAEDLLAALEHEDGAPRSVLLWLDPDAGFTRLRPVLEPLLAAKGVQLLALQAADSQLLLKLRVLEIEASGAAAVVHLPGLDAGAFAPGPGGTAGQLWSLIEYRYKGAVWGHRAGRDELDPLTLDRWLETHDLHFSGGGARAAVVAGGADSRLARFVAKKSYLDPSEFPRSINTTSIATDGDPRDRAVELLMDPRQAVVTWGESVESTRELIADAFGLELGGADSEAWARSLAMHLALLEAWDAVGQPADYPFAARLPATDRARTAGIACVRQTIAPRADVVTRARGLVEGQAVELGGLVDWIAARSGWPLLISGVTDRRVGRLIGVVDDALAAGVDSAVEALRSALPTDPAVRRLDDRLAIMASVVDLAALVARARAAFEPLKDAGAMASVYAMHAWQADAAWLAIAAGAREIAELAPVRRLAARLYAGHVDRLNQQFTDAVEAAGSWPPAGLDPITSDAVSIWERPAKTKDRRAVVIVDAMRMDVARALEGRLGPSASLNARASTLPTTTPFGMSALLPGQNGVAAEVVSGAITLAIDGHTGLDNRAGRKAYVSHILGERGDTVEFMELEDVLQGAPIPGARFVVLFTYALDDQGHSNADTAGLPEEAGRLPGRLARVIERLLASGIARVEVVTDHGFLWLDPQDVDALQHPAPPPAQVAIKSARYLVMEPGATTSDVIRLPMPFNPASELGFPRGIRTVAKAPWYLHGGISLHEAVIPHVVVRAAAAPRRVAAAIVVPVAELSGGTIPVRARPVVDGSGEEQLLLEVPRPLSVKIEVGTVGDTPRAVCDPATLELRHDSPELTTAVYLNDRLRLRAGDKLLLRASDAETGETLFEQPLTMLVDWD